MTKTAIRKKVHQYVDEAEENVLEVVYKLLKLYSGEDSDSLMSEEQKSEIDKRSLLYREGKSKTSSWNSVKKRTRSAR